MPDADIAEREPGAEVEERGQQPQAVPELLGRAGFRLRQLGLRQVGRLGLGQGWAWCRREDLSAGRMRCRNRLGGRQYFGPTNSSSRATAARRATEIVSGLEKRHSTPSMSSASPHNSRMSTDLLLNR